MKGLCSVARILNQLRDFRRVGTEQVYRSAVQDGQDSRVLIKAVVVFFLDRVLAVIERAVPIPIPHRSFGAGDDLPRFGRVRGVAIAAFDAAITDVERLTVYAGLLCEIVRIEWARRRQQNRRGATRRRDGKNLVGQWNRLKDEAVVLVRVKARGIQLPVGIDLIACSPEQIEQLGIGDAFHAGPLRRIETAAATERNVRLRAIRKVQAADIAGRNKAGKRLS